MKKKKKKITRTTLQSWSRASQKYKVIENKEESCSRECVMIDKGTTIVEEQDQFTNFDEETSGNESPNEDSFKTIVDEQVSDGVHMNSLECPIVTLKVGFLKSNSRSLN